ncbi:MAG: LysR family transcriptional regulator [Clostridiales bacterium]|nr:LysR family transcriptional regulator [Clostridiales bacterium]
MNWNQLNYVLTVAQTKNITRAAQMLYLSQPSLSLSLKSLENELGVSLFQREQGGLEPTYAGTLFCQWAEAVLSSHQQLCAQLQDIASGQRQLIRLGISPHRSTILMPEIMEHFYQKFPHCEVHITELPAPILRKQLEEGELDFILDAANPDTVTYQSELLYQENIVLAVPVSFLTENMRKQQSLSLPTLENLPFILLPEEQLIGSIGRKLCAAANYHPAVRLVCGNIEQALSLAGRQLGIVFCAGNICKGRTFVRASSLFPNQRDGKQPGPLPGLPQKSLSAGAAAVSALPLSGVGAKAL